MIDAIAARREGRPSAGPPFIRWVAVGVMLGIVALNAGRGPRTASNDAYHLAILAALVIALALLASPPVRAALRRAP